MQVNATSELLTTDERFLALLCADDELIRAEFDAIIAAEWADEPPRDPGDELIAQPNSGPASTRSTPAQTRLRDHPERGGADGWRRQRSPPGAMLVTRRDSRTPRAPGPFVVFTYWTSRPKS